MIQVIDISYGHTGEPLYEKASFSVSKNTKVGLVGLNGSGKSTLFRMLTGDGWPDGGKVKVEGSIAYVPQEVGNDKNQDEAESVGQYLLSAAKNEDHVLTKILSNMELKDVSLNHVPKELSGGQRTKLALAHALLSEPDILLLDEPTNFMDDAGTKWVMHWLSLYPKTVFMVSHDLNLLDKDIDKIVYINKQTKKFEEYNGNYSKFKRLKSEKDIHLTKFITNQEKQIKRLKKSVEKLRQNSNLKVIRQRVQLEKRIARIEDNLPELPQELVRIKLELPTPAHIGELPIRIKNISKSYEDNQVLSNISFSILKGQRVALIGHNGAGKSTLIKIIIGKIKPDSGEVDLDTNINIGYYSQGMETFDIEKTVYDTVFTQQSLSEGQIRKFLAKFMFKNDAIKRRVRVLSGGEKTRLAIALLMLNNHNFLILDEPTTYLDVMSQSIILEALKAYEGTMLVVSHTPDFLKGLQPDMALLLPEEKYVYWDNALLDKVSEI